MYIIIPVSLLLFRLKDTTAHRTDKQKAKPFEDWVAESILTVNWCTEKLQCNGSENFMCTRNRPEVIQSRKNCLNLKITATPEFRRTILYLHNTMRNNVASGNYSCLPPASNMRQLVILFVNVRKSWDVISEATASVWVSHCRVGKAKCRKTPLSEHGTGQNYYLLATDIANTDKIDPPPDSIPSFKAWAAGLPFVGKELISKYHYHPIFARRQSMIDSSAQLILAWATAIGCSEATYRQSGFLFRALVCNYDIAPLENRMIYRIGKPCSDCSEGTSCNNQSVYPFLCASPEDDDTDGVPIDTEELIRAVVSTANFVHPPPQLLVYLASVAGPLSLLAYG